MHSRHVLLVSVLSSAGCVFAQSHQSDSVPALTVLETCSQQTIDDLGSPWERYPVWVKYAVSQRGDLQSIEVTNTSLSPAIDNAVLRWFRTCKFKPAKMFGAEVAGTGVAAVRFRSATQALEAQNGSVGPDSCRRPEYPVSSFRNSEEGEVVLSFISLMNAKMVVVSLAKSTGHQQLDDHSIAFLLNCKSLPMRSESDTQVNKAFTMSLIWKLQ